MNHNIRDWLNFERWLLSMFAYLGGGLFGRWELNWSFTVFLFDSSNSTFQKINIPGICESLNLLLWAVDLYQSNDRRFDAFLLILLIRLTQNPGIFTVADLEPSQTYYQSANAKTYRVEYVLSIRTNDNLVTIEHAHVNITIRKKFS